VHSNAIQYGGAHSPEVKTHLRAARFEL
jgi:hypothetical protein